jgi:hypothetical protein
MIRSVGKETGCFLKDRGFGVRAPLGPRNSPYRPQGLHHGVDKAMPKSKSRYDKATQKKSKAIPVTGRGGLLELSVTMTLLP